MLKSRYCFNPAHAPKIGRRVTMVSRIRRWINKRRNGRPDVFMVTGYFNPVYPRK